MDPMSHLETTTDADRRHAVADAAIEAFRATDFHRVDRQVVADVAGIDVAEIDRLYPSWELLLVAVADRWFAGTRRGLEDVVMREGAVAFLRAQLAVAAKDPAMIRMRLALIAAGSNPAHPAAGWFQRRYANLYEDLALALVRDIIAKREPKTMGPRHAAEQLLALYEGLQLQDAMHDGGDLLASFDRAVARMRAGWSEAYTR